MIHSRIAAILAGGKSARMGGDKALAIFLGRRLVDIVAARLRPQADALLISGPPNYGLDIEGAPDAADSAEDVDFEEMAKSVEENGAFAQPVERFPSLRTGAA
ncbi:MAG: NTP transferase domain-containing protein, partial [Parvularculaceae bacterium]